MEEQQQRLPQAACVAAPRPTALERRRQHGLACRQARYDEMAAFARRGLSARSIAAQMGLDPRTVRRWLRTGHAPRHDRSPRGSVLDPYRGHLERRWQEGCGNARQLWRELVGLGFAGRPSLVRVWAGRKRKADPDGAGPLRAGAGPSWRPPSHHRLIRLLLAEPEQLGELDRLFCERLLAAEPALAAAVAAGRRLARLLRRDSGEPLAPVLAAAKATALARLAASLERDAAAVQAALELPWTTSPVEGQVNRLKTIKRAMYGRAGFSLLRQRVLHAA
jgi:transposase